MEFLNWFSSHIICSAEKPTSAFSRRGLRGLRKRGSNPYAERGLDRFEVLSAELEAKRKKLVAQLGTQLSVVRFATGSGHHDWIPVIICPTLSKAEVRTLVKTATRLITEDAHATGSTGGQDGVLSGESNSVVKQRECGDRPSRISVAHADDAQNGTLNHLLAASRRFLWMAAFIFSIASDIVRDVFLFKWRAVDAPQQRSLPSVALGRLKAESDNPLSSDMSSSLTVPSLPRIRAPASVSAKAIKVTVPSHVTGHARASANSHNRHKCPGFSTAPSTPRDSRQVKKSLQASVSFQITTHRQEEAPRSAMAKSLKLCKSLSLPKVFPLLQEHATHKSSATSKVKQAVRDREKKQQSEKFGQALTATWLALGLGSLVMGYIPAILCVVCWWYALPSLREAVGDKPHIKSHHR